MIGNITSQKQNARNRQNRLWFGRLLLLFSLLFISSAQAATLYWIGGGSGNFNSGMRWSTTSGGSSCSCTPGSADVATFDGNGTGSVTITANASVAGISIAAGYTGTMTQNSGVTITVGSSGYSQADGTFAGGDSALTVNGAFTLSGGVFTATNGTTTIQGDFTVSAGTFNHNSGSILMSGSSVAQTINTGSATLNNLAVNKTLFGMTVTGTVNIAGNLNLIQYSTITSGVLAVAGDITTTATPSSWASSTTILINGSGAQTLGASGGQGATPGININKPSGTLTIQDTIKVASSAGWTWTAGTVDAGASTVEFKAFGGSGDAMTVNAGSMAFNNVTINMTVWSFSVTGTLTVNGNLNLTSFDFIGGGTIEVAGNVTSTELSTGFPSTVTLLLNGSGAQTLGTSGGTGTVPNITINKPSGTLTIQDTIRVQGNAGWTWVAGAVSAASSTVRFAAVSGQGAAMTVNAGSASFGNIAFEMYEYTLTITGTMVATGDMSIVNASTINGGAINVAGNLTSADSSVAGSTAITLNGTGAQTINTGGTGDLPNGTLTVNKPSGTATLAANLTLNSAGQDITVTSGTLDLAGYNLVLTSAGDALTVDAGATLRLQGGETVTASTKTLNSGSTVIYYGSGSYSSFPLGNNYHHVTFTSLTGAFMQSSPLVVAGNLTIDADFNSSSQNITLGGNWINTGSYLSGNNTVTLNGSNQSISGDTSFRNLTKSVSSADTLTFAAGSTTTVSGLATLDGAVGQLLSLRSSSTPTRWNLNLAGTKSISYVDVQDGDASGSISGNKPVLPSNSTNSGNNVAWFYALVAGTVYTDEGTTTISDGATVRLLVNGVSVGSATTSTGAYTIAPSSAVNAGDAILVFVDDHASKGNTVTVASGSDISNINIYGTNLITRHDNGGVMTNALMAQAKGAYADADILYSVTSGNASMTNNLYTWSGHTYTPGGNVTTALDISNYGTFNGGNYVIDVNDDLAVYTGSTFTATSGAMTISRNFTIQAGATFAHNGGSITIDGTIVHTSLSVGSATLNNLTISKGAYDVFVSGTVDINGNLVITSLDRFDGGIFAVAGNVTSTDAIVYATSNSTILIDGAGNQLLSASGGTGGVPGLSINKSGGTLTVQNTIRVRGSWIYTAGTVDTSSATIEFIADGNGPSATVDAAGMSFNIVNVNKGPFDLTVVGNLDVNSNFTLTSVGTMTGGSVSVAGNVVASDTLVLGTAAITLDGTGAQTINTGGTGDLPDGTLTINKASGTATLASNLTLNSAGQDVTVTAGTLDLTGYNLVLTSAGDVLTVDTGATLRLQGGETVTATTRTFNAGSTVIYNGGAAYGSLSLGNTYSNLTFNGTGSWAHTGALSVKDLTITQGTLSSGGQNITLTGNWSNSGTYTSGSNTVTFNGTNQSITGNTIFNNLTKSVAAADTLTFAAGSTTTVNGLATLNGAAGQLLSLRSSSTPTRWNLNLAGTKSISYVDVQDSNASGSAVANKPVLPSNSANSGNNVFWFPAVISGTVYTDEGTTAIGGSITVRLLVNGMSRGSTTTSSGAYTITPSVTLVAGDAILVFIENDTTNGATVSVASGGDISNFNIYGTHIITRQDNSGALTNANMSTAKGSYTDTYNDINYSVASGNLTVSNSHELYVLSGHSYSPTGNIITPSMENVGTFNGGSGTITVNGAFTLSGGAFTSTTGTLSVSPTAGASMTMFTYSGGTFTHNSGTLSLNPTNSSCGGSITFTVSLLSPLTVNHLIANGVIGCAGMPITSVTGSAITAQGNFTHTDGQFDGASISLQGNLVVGASADGGSSTVTINGNSAQTYTYTASGKTVKLVVDTTGSFTPAGGTTALSSRTLNLINGTFTAPTGTLTVGNAYATETAFSTASGTTFNNSNGTVAFTPLSSCSAYTMTVSLASGHTLYDTVINGVDGGCNGNYGTVAASGTIITTNSFQHSSGFLTGAWEVRGNFTVGSSARNSTGTITLNGNGAQTYSYGASGTTAKLIVDTTGSVTPAGGTTALAARSLSVVNGTFTAPTGTLTIGNAAATETSFATAVGTTFNNNNGTIAFIQLASCTAHYMTVSPTSGHTFYNVSFTGTDGGCNGNWGAITSVGTIVVTNNFQHSSGVLNGTWEVRGNLTMGASARGGSATVAFTGTNNQTYTNSGGNEPDGSYTVNKASGTVTLASAMNLNATSQALTITSGTLDLASYALTVTSALTVGASGTLQLQGGETVTTGSKVFNAGSTVIYNGAVSYSSLALGNSYTNANLIFNSSAAGSWTHTGALTATNLTITQGTLLSGGQNITLSGNWSNSGTYTSGSNTVTFSGTNQSITGNTTFNNLTKSVASAATLTFAAGSTTTVNGLATLNGAAGQLLSLRSSSTPTRWNLNLAGTKSISYVDVQDSDASGSTAGNKPVLPSNSTNSGNNVAWFAAVIGGTVYTNEGTTTIADGATVRLLVNGVSQGTATTSSGVYSITPSVTLAAGDAILVFIDSHATNGTTVSVASGNDISNFNIYGSHIIVRQDNGGSLSNTNMSTAKGAYSDPSTDINYAVASGNLTVNNAHELYVWLGHSYTPAGNITTTGMENLGTFTGGSGSITVQGSLVLTSGAFTATSGTTSISSFFTISGGTFNHNSGTISFGSTGWRQVNTGSATLNDVVFSYGGTSQLDVIGTMNVAGNFTVTSAGTLGSGTIAVSGNVTTTDSQFDGAGKVLFTGSGAQTLSVNGAGGTGALPGVSISKTGGVLTIQDNIEIDGTGNWLYTDNGAAGSDVAAGTSKIIFPNNGSGTALNSGAMSFNDVQVDLSSNALTVTGTMTVTGTLTLTSGNVNSGTIAAKGNVVTTVNSGGATGTLLINGTGAQTLSAAGSSGHVPNINIDKSSGTLTLQDTINLGGTSWTHTSGTVDASTSTVGFTNSSQNKSVNAAGMTFNNVTIDIGDTNIFFVNSAFDINGNLTISTVTEMRNNTITVAGNLTSTDASVDGTTAITLDGTGAQAINVLDIPDGVFTINKSSGTATLAANLTLNSAGQDLTVTAGTLDLAGLNLVLTSAGDVLSVANGATLQLQGGETVTASTVTLNSGSTVVYNGTVGPYTLKTWTYHHLTVSGAATFNLGAATTAGGNLTVGSGATLDATASNYNITLSGNWSNSGTYTSGSNTVTFSGTNQSITGNTTFYNLTKSVATADTLIFAAGATQTVNGLLTLNGASGQRLSLRSSVNATKTYLTLGVGGTQSISYVDVKDNDASGGQTLVAPNSVDSLNNVNWDFGLSSAQLIKQVWDNAGNCLASSPADANCRGGATSASVPAGVEFNFMIIIRNASALAANDARFQDTLDASASGFTYVPGSMKMSSSQANTATLAQLYTAVSAGTLQTDALGAPDDFASALSNVITVGAVTGQANQVVSIPGQRSFALLFKAVKN